MYLSLSLSVYLYLSASMSIIMCELSHAYLSYLNGLLWQRITFNTYLLLENQWITEIYIYIKIGRSFLISKGLALCRGIMQILKLVVPGIKGYGFKSAKRYTKKPRQAFVSSSLDPLSLSAAVTRVFVC
jgi:hypothetical protein